MTYFADRMLLPRFGRTLAFLILVLTGVASLVAAQTADRERITAFLNVTGFDVALDSIALSASGAPSMLGLPEDDFGEDWKRLVGEVFDTRIMRDLAVEILAATLSDKSLAHAAEFYASDLGQRLVAAENAAHMDPDGDANQQSGREIIAGLVADGATRLEIIKRMNRAVHSAQSSVRALQEVQIRFLLAANAAGVIKLGVDAKGLRALMKSQEAEMTRSIQKSALAGAAFTYRDFSDADIEAYAVALEHPDMMLVYELLNAVQYEIMANRFEVLATRMANLHPPQDI